MSKILVVEDNPDLAFGLRNNLEIEGYDVSVAEDGPTGLERVRTINPELVILDLMLPGLDGYRVLKTLREEHHQMPVLILTARGEEADKVRGFRLGADDYVTKPFGVVELMARVDAHLRRGAGGNGAHGTGLSDDVLRERHGLTERQIEVARLLAQGCSNAEIAESLGIAVLTARNHTDQVLLKLGAATRARVGAILRGQAT
jgi:DNA-binding response OmpR family regulator